MPGYNYNSSPVLIYIRVLDKNGRSVQKNLELDMEDFSKRKHKIDFFDFPIINLNYEYSSKKYLINDNQTDYLCYIDPDYASPNYVIFVLTGPTESCDKYLEKFQELIASFRWFKLTVTQ